MGAYFPPLPRRVTCNSVCAFVAGNGILLRQWELDVLMVRGHVS